LGLREHFLLSLAKRWISGVDLPSAMHDAEKANSRGMGAVINLLGEDISDPSVADSHAGEYLKLQEAMANEGIKGHASVKLTQLGLRVDPEGTARRLEKIRENSQRLGQLLWVDMEGSKFTDATLSMYHAALGNRKGLGVALQAYMRRSESDLRSLLGYGGTVRLVKGAYRESSGIIYPSKSAVRDNFARLMEILFEGGDGFAIATHDSVLVDRAKALADSKHVDFWFEMLKGIRDDLKEELVKSGYKVYEYLPYGDRWFAYSKRRITEHPSNILLLLRSLV
jgi:proline dehydrogenase